MGRALLVLDNPNVKDKAVDWIRRAPVGTRVEFKASKRSLPQNDLMWALLTEVSQQYEHNGRKYDPASWKAIFLHAFGREISFLPSLDMKTFLPIELSSSDLSKDEMTNFIEFIIKEGTERGVVFREHNTEASAATPPDATVVSDADPSPALQEPAGNPAPPAGSLSPEKWLLNVSRMLWAATKPNGDYDVLKNQKASAIIAFPKPDGCPDRIVEKAEAVFRRCRDVIETSIEQTDALALIASIVGVDQDDILERAA